MLRIFVAAASALVFGACTGEADAPDAAGASEAAPKGAAAVSARAPRAVAPAVVGCARRVEPGVERFDRRIAVVRGPLAFGTLARDLPVLSRASYRPRHGRLAGVKLPVGLRAGHRATLRVDARQRDHAALRYTDRSRTAERVQDGDRAVTFRSCPENKPGFSGGTVGPVTGWAGSLFVTGPRCVRLEVFVHERRLRDVRLPLGRRCR